MLKCKVTLLIFFIDVAQSFDLREIFPNKPCGLQFLSNRIVGGQDTEIDEFPWTALLFYRNGKGLKYKCGGSLISEKTIVSILFTKYVTLIVRWGGRMGSRASY